MRACFAAKNVDMSKISLASKISSRPPMQLEYGCNVLNLGNERIISVHKETARQVGAK